MRFSTEEKAEEEYKLGEKVEAEGGETRAANEGRRRDDNKASTTCAYRAVVVEALAKEEDATVDDAATAEMDPGKAPKDGNDDDNNEGDRDEDVVPMLAALSISFHKGSKDTTKAVELPFW